MYWVKGYACSCEKVKISEFCSTMVPAEAYISTPRCDNQIRSKVPASEMVPLCGKLHLMQIPDIAIRSVLKTYSTGLLICRKKKLWSRRTWIASGAWIGFMFNVVIFSAVPYVSNCSLCSFTNSSYSVTKFISQFCTWRRQFWQN